MTDYNPPIRGDEDGPSDVIKYFDGNNPTNSDPGTIPGAWEAPSGDSDGTSLAGLAVNTDALRLFGKRMVYLEAAIDVARRSVREVDIRPGTLPAGNNLVNIIQGTPDGTVMGLKADVLGFLNSMEQVFADLGTDVANAAKIYDSTEDLNSATAAEVKDTFWKTFSGINGLDSNGDYGYGDGSSGSDGSSSSGGDGNGGGSGGGVTGDQA